MGIEGDDVGLLSLVELNYVVFPHSLSCVTTSVSTVPSIIDIIPRMTAFLFTPN